METSRQKKVDLLRKNKGFPANYNEQLQDIGEELVGSPSDKRAKKRSIPLIEMRKDLKDDIEIIFEELLNSYSIPTNQETYKTRESDRYTSVLESHRQKKVELKAKHKRKR